MFLLYNILLFLLLPFWLPWMLWRTRARKEAPNWAERQGNYKLERRKDGQRVWIHAVSVGEVVAALPILREVRAQLPEHEIVLSVTTSSGRQTAREQAEGLYDHLVYFPIDIARFQLSAMQRVQPSVVAVMETELWMNFLWAAKVFDAKTLLINGRISDRSFPRSMKIRFYYRALLKDVDRCLMQSRLDAERIQALGAQDVEVLGNCKFDQAVEGLDADPEEWRQKLGIPADGRVVVIGSTRGEMEEDFVLEAVQKLLADDELNAYFVHAPRHIERAAAITEKASARGFGVGLRSKGESGRYVILDTYGELSKVYSVADVVVIGGGFDKLGGQNLIQPLAHGKPVIHGPHMQNFRDVAAMAREAGATWTVENPYDLAVAIDEVLENQEVRQGMGEAASRLVQENLGASKRYGKAIKEAAEAFSPRR